MLPNNILQERIVIDWFSCSHQNTNVNTLQVYIFSLRLNRPWTHDASCKREHEILSRSLWMVPYLLIGWIWRVCLATYWNKIWSWGCCCSAMKCKDNKGEVRSYSMPNYFIFDWVHCYYVTCLLVITIGLWWYPSCKRCGKPCPLDGNWYRCQHLQLRWFSVQVSYPPNIIDPLTFCTVSF